jgi:hypothetical protein
MRPIPRPAPATVTPAQAYEAFRDAVAASDYNGIWPLLSKSTQDDFTRRAAEFEMQLRNRTDTPAGAKAMLDAMGLTAEDVRASEQRIVSGHHMMLATLRLTAQKDPEHFKRIARSRYARDETSGDRGRVYVIIDGKTQDEPMTVVREGTLWKIELGR